MDMPGACRAELSWQHYILFRGSAATRYGSECALNHSVTTVLTLDARSKAFTVLALSMQAGFPACRAILLTHGFSNYIGTAHGKASQSLHNLHYLFLIYNYPISWF